MATSLKSQNNIKLYGLLVANLVVFAGAVQSNALLAGDWTDLTDMLGRIAPATAGVVLVGILNGLLPPDVKARLVFLRWNDPLPGSEAFTRHRHGDPRIDNAALESTYGPFPTQPKEQNAAWYRLYRSVGEDVAVMDAHRTFLLARDYCALAFLAFLVLAPLSYLFVDSAKVASVFLGALVLQVLVAWQAARSSGVRLVTTVLALKSAGH